jgi:hypothetical protein
VLKRGRHLSNNVYPSLHVHTSTYPHTAHGRRQQTDGTRKLCVIYRLMRVLMLCEHAHLGLKLYKPPPLSSTPSQSARSRAFVRAVDRPIKPDVCHESRYVHNIICVYNQQGHGHLQELLTAQWIGESTYHRTENFMRRTASELTGIYQG